MKPVISLGSRNKRLRRVAIQEEGREVDLKIVDTACAPKLVGVVIVTVTVDVVNAASPLGVDVDVDGAVTVVKPDTAAEGLADIVVTKDDIGRVDD